MGAASHASQKSRSHPSHLLLPPHRISGNPNHTRSGSHLSQSLSLPHSPSLTHSHSHSDSQAHLSPQAYVQQHVARRHSLVHDGGVLLLVQVLQRLRYVSRHLDTLVPRQRPLEPLVAWRRAREQEREREGGDGGVRRGEWECVHVRNTISVHMSVHANISWRCKEEEIRSSEKQGSGLSQMQRCCQSPVLRSYTLLHLQGGSLIPLSFAQSPSHWVAPNHSLTDSLSHSLTHSVPHSLTHSNPESFTHLERLTLPPPSFPPYPHHAGGPSGCHLACAHRPPIVGSGRCRGPSAAPAGRNRC